MKPKISLIIPCFNEAESIGSVLKSIPKTANIETIVIDNNSRDQTATIAKKMGAKVIFEPRQGKGYAVRTGIKNIDKKSEYVVMLDGDNTYRPEEIFRLVEPLQNNFCDVILGSRLSGKVKPNSMKFHSRVGNWFFSFLVRFFYVTNVTDVLTGYFAWKTDAIKKLLPVLTSQGFEIEMEMITKMAKMGYGIYSVPITYDKRIGKSNLSSIKDGIKIFKEFLKNLQWKPQK